MSEASLDQIDAAVFIGTGKAPHDRVLFNEKAAHLAVPLELLWIVFDSGACPNLCNSPQLSAKLARDTWQTVGVRTWRTATV